MKRLLGFVVIAAFVLALATVAMARGAPQSEQSIPFVEVIVTPSAPVVCSVPPLTVGYDVIQNLSESKTLKPSVTTERRRQSTTGDENTNRARPRVVLLT